MQVENPTTVTVKTHVINSAFLNRVVQIDCYLPAGGYAKCKKLLLINDGQDLPKMPFEDMLTGLYDADLMEPVFCVGIYCSSDRKNEYGTARIIDYKGRGAKAMNYSYFIFKELLPFLSSAYKNYKFSQKNFAGFSLGGLSALDLVWNAKGEFTYAGIFSGSLWWRDKDSDDEDFDEDENRIMHKQIRKGKANMSLKFFFEVGTQDEGNDRNGNGIIDSIDDTLSFIAELTAKGYDENSIKYLELSEGTHDVPTWALAFPVFLIWAFGK